MEVNQNHREINPDLLHRIPVTSRTVLEVGCNDGALGKEFKRINPNVRYIGVESIPSLANEARKTIDHVIEGRLSDLDLEKLNINENELDCIIFNKTIESLEDIGRDARRLMPLLMDDGNILISFSNIQNWMLIERILKGNWPTQRNRFKDHNTEYSLTKEAIVKAIGEMGLEVQSVTPRIRNHKEAAQFCEAIEPALKNLKINMKDFLNSAAPEEYVLKASKRPVSRLQIQRPDAETTGGNDRRSYDSTVTKRSEHIWNNSGAELRWPKTRSEKMKRLEL